MSAPQGQCKLQLSLFFLSHRMMIMSLATSVFKMLPVLSSDCLQQAVYHPSADIDTVLLT
jgi:hypothetical protein